MTSTKFSKLFLIPLTAATIIGFLGWWANHRLKSEIQDILARELDTILKADITALEIWINSQVKAVKLIASESTFRNLSVKLLHMSAKNDKNSDALKKSDELSQLRKYLLPRIDSLGYRGFSIINNEGVFIGKNADTHVGHRIHSKHMDSFSAHVKSGTTVLVTPFKPETIDQVSTGLSESIMVIATSIKDESGKTLLTLGLDIEPEDFTRILTVARSGKSGETYAFDDKGVMISNSRFEKQLRDIGLLPENENINSVLNIEIRNPGGDLTMGYQTEVPRAAQPLTFLAAKAISGEDGINVEGYRDYRGVMVVGSWGWLPDYNFGVATEIDLSEAYRPLYVLRKVFTFLFVLLTLSAIMMLVFSYIAINFRSRMKDKEMEARQLGQYKLTKKIGEGGMGQVYLAEHALLKRPTAVKLLTPEKASRESIVRFEREVQLTSQLTHPNTIQIYDYGHTPDGIFYYAMEYLTGIDLKQLIKIDGAQLEERVIHILKQVCGSLAEAHDVGLIHRDIKPANIVLTNRGGAYDIVKVLDFGLIKDIKGGGGELDITNPDTISGTPQYLAPETITDPLNVDARSDIYSLGALGYLLLSGKDVFIAKTVVEICKHHLLTPPRKPSDRFKRNYNTSLENIIMKCLEKEPEHRFSNARTLLDELRFCKIDSNWSQKNANEWWTQQSDKINSQLRSDKPSSKVTLDSTLAIDIHHRERIT